MARGLGEHVDLHERLLGATDYGGIAEVIPGFHEALHEAVMQREARVKAQELECARQAYIQRDIRYCAPPPFKAFNQEYSNDPAPKTKDKFLESLAKCMKEHA